MQELSKWTERIEENLKAPPENQNEYSLIIDGEFLDQVNLHFEV